VFFSPRGPINSCHLGPGSRYGGYPEVNDCLLRGQSWTKYWLTYRGKGPLADTLPLIRIESHSESPLLSAVMFYQMTSLDIWHQRDADERGMMNPISPPGLDHWQKITMCDLLSLCNEPFLSRLQGAHVLAVKEHRPKVFGVRKITRGSCPSSETIPP